MKCVSCGTEISDTSKYCSECGAKQPESKTDFSFTEKPVLLEEGAEGTAGTKGKYLLFGDWPQTLKASEVKIDESRAYRINNWKCYKGSDGGYYVKEQCCPHDCLDEGTYNPTVFDNGEKLEDGEYYYFKMESIKWRILGTDYSGGKLLLAEKILVNTDSYFCNAGSERKIEGSIINENNYKYSEARAFLNGLDGSKYDAGNYKNYGFLNQAFSPSARDLIKTACIDEAENINDKIFLLSQDDVTNKKYGFSVSDVKDSSRLRKPTDYAKGVGVLSESGTNYATYSDWWLRTPSKTDPIQTFTINCEGLANRTECVPVISVGIVPALMI